MSLYICPYECGKCVEFGHTRLSVIMMCQGHKCNKFITLVRDGDRIMKEESTWEFSAPFSQFYCEPKMLL
jgi:hypothetical protein